MTIQTTQKYFNKTVDELLEVRNEYGYTREECLLFDDGIKIVFYDDKKEMAAEKDLLKEYMKSASGNPDYDMEIKAILQTINERIAVVLV